MRAPSLICLGLLAALNGFAAAGHIVLLNGTSSAGKSSLAEAIIAESTNRFEVVSFDDFYHAYRARHRVSRLTGGQYQDFLLSMYRHARALSDAATNVIIDTVEFDRAAGAYCDILNCSNVIKAVVYCPLQDILARIDRRNGSPNPSDHRAVLICFQQFLETYKLQSSPAELVVEKTSTGVIRAALVEAGRKTNNPRLYDSLYRQYEEAFGIDRDREIILVPKGKYDLVLNTRANTKRKNVRLVEEFLKNRR